eukprot:3051679-Rhodomonas_salina.1
MARGLSQSFRAITASFRAKTSGWSSLSLNTVCTSTLHCPSTLARLLAPLALILFKLKSR